jgi:hypothetical protein
MWQAQKPATCQQLVSVDRADDSVEGFRSRAPQSQSGYRPSRFASRTPSVCQPSQGISPHKHCPPWDDAGAEAQRRAVASISHVVLCPGWASIAEVKRPLSGHSEAAWARLAGANVTAYILCGVPRPLWRRPRHSPRAPAAAFGDGDLRPAPMNIGPRAGRSSGRVVLGTSALYATEMGQVEGGRDGQLFPCLWFDGNA